MRTFYLSFLLFLSQVLEAQTTSARDSIVTESSVHFTANFPQGEPNRRAIMDSLEGNYHRILRNFLVDTVPPVHFNFFASKDALHKAAKTIKPDLPSFSIGFVQDSRTVYIVSPNSRAKGFGFSDLLPAAIHEFVHCVTLHINKDFANNPRWLWESVAMFEVGQFPLKGSLLRLEHKGPASISELNQKDGIGIYELGSLYTQFIVEKWGRLKLKQLILANGNLESTLQITEQKFEEDWLDWVKTTYFTGG